MRFNSTLLQLKISFLVVALNHMPNGFKHDNGTETLQCNITHRSSNFEVPFRKLAAKTNREKHQIMHDSIFISFQIQGSNIQDDMLLN